MLVPVSSHLMPIIHECLCIALQSIEDEQMAAAIKEVMFQLEQAEMNADGVGSVRFLAGFEDMKLH